MRMYLTSLCLLFRLAHISQKLYWIILKAPKLLKEKTQPCRCVHTIWLCFWLSHMNNLRKCQLGNYGEESRQWQWFTKTHFIHNYKLTLQFNGFRASWHIYKIQNWIPLMRMYLTSLCVLFRLRRQQCRSDSPPLHVPWWPTHTAGLETWNALCELRPTRRPMTPIASEYV